MTTCGHTRNRRHVTTQSLCTFILRFATLRSVRRRLCVILRLYTAFAISDDGGPKKMPSRRGSRGFLTALAEVAPHEAVVLFGKLRELGHITASQLHEARQAVAREISDLTERLSTLRNARVSDVSTTNSAPAGRPSLRSPGRVGLEVR